MQVFDTGKQPNLTCRSWRSLIVLATFGLVAPGCWGTHRDEIVSERLSDQAVPAIGAQRELLVHCGNSMRPAAEMLAPEFERRYGIPVRLNFGGSADLLSSIELGRKGDLYLPHDPYAEMLEEKGLLDYYEVVGYIEPIVIVAKGNPHGIRSMEELATRQLTVALPDARYATAGKLIEAAFREKGLLDQLQANVTMEARGHNEVAMALVSGHVDAAMVWSFIASSYQDRVDRIVPAKGTFPKNRVTLCLLTLAQDRDAAQKFMELATSEFGQQVFRERGYLLEPGQ